MKFLKSIFQKNLKKYPIFKTFNLLITAIIIKLFFNNFSYQISHYFLKLVYKKNKFYFKRIYPVLYHNFRSEIPELYNHDFNWIMNDVAIYNLKKVEKDFDERIRKAKIYFQEIDDNVALKLIVLMVKLFTRIYNNLKEIYM